MKVVKFEEIFDLFVSNLRSKSLIPVIGSGFTAGCNCFKGTVPSTQKYKQDMEDELYKKLCLTEEEFKQLKSESFSSVAALYIKEIDDDVKRNYFLSYFTKVCINEHKRNFLKIDWSYIYTLNFDDCIETNCDYQRVIRSNEKVYNDIFNQYKCLIKLHGDVNEVINYNNYNSLIFSNIQYANSIKKNEKLLNKFKHDAIYQNLLFVGCSLNDEIDILQALSVENSKNLTNRFICVVNEPSTLQLKKYEQFGITCAIKFNSYEDIYKNIFKAWLESKKVRKDDLVEHKRYLLANLSDSFEDNKPYFLFGKSLIHKNKINIPYFFIERDITCDIVKRISKYYLQFIFGSSYSGKTYILYDIITKIRDRDVFVFESKDRLNNSAFNELCTFKDSLFLFDSNSLTINQIEMLIEKKKLFETNRNHAIIFASKRDSDIHGLLRLLEEDGRIEKGSIFKTSISNKFSNNEVSLFNPKLSATTLGVFYNDKTILDNIINLSKKLSEKNRFDKIRLSFNDNLDIVTLIILAIENKVYTTQVVKFDIMESMFKQMKIAHPIIDLEETWSYETSSGDNSPKKYVVNAEYWLYNELGAYAKNNHSKIVNAFKYIISKILKDEGQPDILKYSNSSYKKYILFDNINRIFRTNKKDGIILIKKIYEGLNSYLSSDPNYLHQRAKCYIRCAYYENRIENKLDLLDKSYRDANVAYQIFDQRFNDCGNEKLLISMAHIKYTIAVILCRKCVINNYDNEKENSEAIEQVYEALNSPFNSYDYAKSDTIVNYDNVVSIFINAVISKGASINDDLYIYAEDLFKIIRNAKS